MKKIYSFLIAIILLLASGKSFSQALTITMPDTSDCGALSSDIECYVGDTLINNSSSPLAIKVVRVQDVAVTGWQTQFCLSVCYLTTTDSVSFTIPANSKQGLIVHFLTSATSGAGSCYMEFRNINTPSNIFYQHFHVTAPCGLGVNELSTNTADVTIYPSPIASGSNFTMNITNVQNPSNEISLAVYNIYGSLISKTTNLKAGVNALNLGLPSGVYSYSLMSDNVIIHSGNMVVVK